MQLVAVVLMGVGCVLMGTACLMALRWRKTQEPRVRLLPTYRVGTMAALVMLLAMFLAFLAVPGGRGVFQAGVAVMGFIAISLARSWQGLVQDRAQTPAAAAATDDEETKDHG